MNVKEDRYIFNGAQKRTSIINNFSDGTNNFNNWSFWIRVVRTVWRFGQTGFRKRNTNYAL